MALEILERIETSLVEKREAVTKFLETASDAERSACTRMTIACKTICT